VQKLRDIRRPIKGRAGEIVAVQIGGDGVWGDLLPHHFLREVVGEAALAVADVEVLCGSCTCAPVSLGAYLLLEVKRMSLAAASSCRSRAL
jgi:hypothetical protein